MTRSFDKQQLFNDVMVHLRKQGRRATDDGGQCLYRGPEGTMCAIGALIPDAQYYPNMEGAPIRYRRSIREVIFGEVELSEEAQDFLQDIQRDLHDGLRDENFPTLLEAAAQSFAIQHRLEIHGMTRCTIDFTKPIELLDGTPMKLSGNGEDGQWTVSTVDDQRIDPAKLGEKAYGGSGIIVEQFGIRPFNRTGFGPVIRNVAENRFTVAELEAQGYTVTPPPPPAPTQAERNFVADISTAMGLTTSANNMRSGQTQFDDRVRKVMEILNARV